MNIWLKVTNDEYELPVAVADTAGELAKICGVTKGTILKQMYEARKSKSARKFSCYKKVEVEEDGEDS